MARTLTFLHIPKVETLAPTVTIEAVAIAGGSEVAKSLGFEINPMSTQPEKEPAAPNPVEDLEFIQNQDIANVEPKPVELPQPEPEVKPEPVIKPPTQPEAVEFQPAKNNNFLNKLKSLPGLMLTPFKKGLTIFKNINLRKRSMAGILALIGLGLAVILAGLVAAWWYLPKAEVTIYLEPKVLEKNLSVTLDPNITEPNLDKQVIPAVLETVSVEDQQSSPTTGTGLVGDPASGQVTIYNKTDLEHTFEAGSILIGPDNNTFELDNEVAVASQSAHDEGVVYGKASAQITATFIGQDGNLPAGSEFGVKDYPETVYSAKAETGLTGGTSREVQAVDEVDQETLLTDLTEKLTQKATDQLNKNLSDKTILKESLTTEIEEEDFNHDVGDETDSLTLNLKIQAQGLAYSPEIFSSLLFKTLEDQVPSGFILYQENIDIQIKDISLDENNTGQLEAAVKAKLIPQINKTQILENLVGRYPPLVQDYLKTLPNFDSADISLKPSLPAKLNTLPHMKNNIELKVEVKD